MANFLGFKINQLEIFEGGYTPQGWSEIEYDQTAIRRFAASLQRASAPCLSQCWTTRTWRNRRMPSRSRLKFREQLPMKRDMDLCRQELTQ
jgi:hypothetical protein